MIITQHDLGIFILGFGLGGMVGVNILRLVLKKKYNINLMKL